MSKFGDIVAAIEHLADAFEAAHLQPPEIVVEFNDQCELMAMAKPYQMVETKQRGEHKIAGIIVRLKEKPVPLYTYVERPETPKEPAPPHKDSAG